MPTTSELNETVLIKNALISVWEKSGLDALVRDLAAKGVGLYATQGTAGYLKERLGVNVTAIESITQFPEMMEGRVKTLHPKIFGGILARREVAKDMEEAKHFEVPLIDLVIGNLYPFGEHLTKTTKEQSSFVDIGGPSLLRAAAKNHISVTVLSSPEDYTAFLEEWKGHDGRTRLAFRKQQAAKTFQRTAAYDGLIAATWTDTTAGAFSTSVSLTPQTSLRYGENPHQKAAFVQTPSASWKVLQGKELSYNNLLDAEAAVALTSEFSETTAVIIKHNNPCGVASQAGSLEKVFQTALACDEKSAFGGIVSVNREVDGPTALKMAPIFFEVIIAPQFSAEAREVLAAKKNLRLIEWAHPAAAAFDLRRAMGGWLIQDSDRAGFPASLQTVTRESLSPETLADLKFAWLVCKHVKSNAIVIAKNGRTLGVGAGQMSRVDSVEIALSRVAEADRQGAVLASDAFFPFRDNIDRLKGTGIRAVIQPGGSQRDAEVIQACDEHRIAMAFTGQRHFRH